jgi:hypothetical protein
MRPHVAAHTPPHRLGMQAGADATAAEQHGTPVAPQKTRVALQCGDVSAVLGWHYGASAGDIRDTITRRFSIDEGVNWAFVDGDGDELVVSHAIPSGSYKILVSGTRTDDGAEVRQAAAARPVVTVENEPSPNCKVELADKLDPVEEVVILNAATPEKTGADVSLDQAITAGAGAEI